jgi:nicotinamide riboside kinase
MTAVNVASLAVLTSVGINWMLDSVKDKKDQALREEMKDRLHETLVENNRRLMKLESDVAELVSSCLLDDLAERQNGG